MNCTILSNPKSSAIARHADSLRRLNIGTIAFLFLVIVSTSSCKQSWWQQVRERERIYALENARNRTMRGQCAEGLESLDRAEAKLDIGVFAREAVSTRIRCYGKLGLEELAAAHRRLLSDFYSTEPMALPLADGTSVFRVDRVSIAEYQAPPAWLRIESPRYSEYARRSNIIGRVVVAYDLAKDGTPKRIRILEMPHPLLATWAIEAIARSRPKERVVSIFAPNARFVSKFTFEWRWADQG